MAPPYRVLLFDIDGTLVTTGGARAAAWKRAFEDLRGILPQLIQRRLEYVAESEGSTVRAGAGHVLESSEQELPP
jgi:beta-phosphoglucomutase-like phosphatase (HAD superfamily)